MKHTGVRGDHLCQPQGSIPAQRRSCFLSPVMEALRMHLKVTFGSCHKHIGLPNQRKQVCGCLTSGNSLRNGPCD